MDLFAYCKVCLNPKMFLLTSTFRAFMAQIWENIYNIVHIILVNQHNSYKINKINFLFECFINALISLLDALGASFGGCLRSNRPAPINVGIRCYKTGAVF